MTSRNDTIGLTRALDAYSRRLGLTLSQRQLLHHAALGASGTSLAVAMRVKERELESLLKLFLARAGRSLEQAAREVNGIVRARRSYAPPNETLP